MTVPGRRCHVTDMLIEQVRSRNPLSLFGDAAGTRTIGQEYRVGIERVWRYVGFYDSLAARST